MVTLRTFIAIDVPASLRPKLEALMAQLRSRTDPDSVRWVRAENIHLTLKFFGDLPIPVVDGLKAMLDEVAGRHSPFPVTVTGLGGFPNPRQPLVVWVGAREPTGALKRLYHDLETGASRLGFESEEREFSPHLTLGRTRRGLPPVRLRKLGETLAALQATELGELYADHVSLFSSDLRPTGPVYSRLSVARLSG